jgi:hypothetical protein
MSDNASPTISRSELQQLLEEMEDVSNRAYSSMDDHFNKFYELDEFNLKGMIELYISSEMLKDYVHSSFELDAGEGSFDVSEPELMLMANLVMSMNALKLDLKISGLTLETQ